MEGLWIGCAFLMGHAVKKVGLPALVGYLLAGFIINSINGYFSLGDTASNVLNKVAHVGILLLLFSVGLKLKVSQVVKKEVVGTGVLHMLISLVMFTPFIMFMFGEDLKVAIVLAGLFSFSSTVLAVKVLDNKQELKAFHGRIAIGILIIQDLLAMIMLSATSGHLPSVWAILVALIAFLPVTKTVLYKILDKSGHDEMLILCGLVLAVVVGGQGFHYVGLSGELGALVVGVLCSQHEKSNELSKSLWGIKELFLVAFFLTIGLNGMPTLDDVYFAFAMVALLPLQALAFFGLLTLFKLKARSAFLASMSLTNFSEFGLIVAAVAAPEWIIPVALAVALSFVVSAPLNHFSHQLFSRYENRLAYWERLTKHPDDEPISLGSAKLLIMGMGRIGRSAYKEALDKLPSSDVIGFDSDPDKVKKLSDRYNVLYADAENVNFWSRLDVSKLDSVILAMDCPNASVITTKALRKIGFNGIIVAHSEYSDLAREVESAGADSSYITSEEAGKGLFSSLMGIRKY